jgi:hypothetical protein
VLLTGYTGPPWSEVRHCLNESCGSHVHCLCRIPLSKMWLLAVWLKFRDIWEEPTAFVVRKSSPEYGRSVSFWNVGKFVQVFYGVKSLQAAFKVVSKCVYASTLIMNCYHHHHHHRRSRRRHPFMFIKFNDVSRNLWATVHEYVFNVGGRIVT